jgi:hypothetical protein
MAHTIFVKIQRKPLGPIFLIGLFLFARPLSIAGSTVADPVLEWNAIMNNTVIAGGTSPLVTSRVVALVSASVFDAVNGIKPRYRSFHVSPNAPRHASQRAAAIQAAYAMLINLYPKQLASLTTQHDASMAALASEESAEAINAGSKWGQAVADNIWAWRMTDGFTPGTSAVPRRPWDRRFVGSSGRLAADSFVEPVRRRPAVRLHDAVGVAAPIAVPPAAAPSAHQPRVRYRLQRNKE